MGMPSIAYSFYPLLYNLASPSRQHYRQAVTAIGPFSLFAFVLCSPDNDDGFHEVLARHFRYLDVATADRLLFYAPIDEPPEWREQRERCHIGKSLFDFYSAIRYCCRSHDPQGTEHALATTLGIDLKELPAVVLTTDPRSSEYVLLRTSKTHLREQLLGLGDLAQDIPPIRDRGDNATGYNLTLQALRRRRLDLCGGVASPELMESLADALHQVLSVALVHETDPGHAYYAWESSRRVVEHLRTQIQKARETLRIVGSVPEHTEDSPVLVRMFQLQERLATYLALATADQGKGYPRFDTPDGWDAESIRWLLLGDRVGHVLARRADPDGQQPGATDYSPSAVCWCKAFEAELNYSLAHWVREILGVRLPPYYGKVQDGIRAVFSSSDGTLTVDFNRRRRAGEDSWKPPGLGLLHGPVFHYLKRQHSVPLDQAKQRLLGQRWETVRQIRNDVCHPCPVNRERAAVVRQALCELNRASVFGSLAGLKRRLRGEAAEAQRPYYLAPEATDASWLLREADATDGAQSRSAPAVTVKPPWWKFWKSQ
jgi:hypothetical protein